MTGKCELCGCETELTLHHLVPVVKCKNKYKEIRNEDSNHTMICRPCHDYIHATYDENELRDRLNTVEKLKEDEKIGSFIKWRSKHENFKGHSKMSNDRKSKNKR